MVNERMERLRGLIMNLKSMKIISGGQTGAGRAGLDWAIKNGIPHGGWRPKGRKAEDGPLDAKYRSSRGRLGAA